jgi:hypothetical protein
MQMTPVSENVQAIHLKSALDLAIESFNKKHATKDEKIKQDKFLTAERNHIKNLANIQEGLNKYRLDGSGKLTGQLISESHSSKRLGRFLRAQGKPRPNIKWDAHHVIAGGDASAALARTVIAKEEFKVRIDDPDNGCWLPKTREDARGSVFPNAVPHENIHRNTYYDWVYSVIVTSDSEMEIRAKLKLIGQRLQQGSIPPNIFDKKSIKKA